MIKNNFVSLVLTILVVFLTTNVVAQVNTTATNKIHGFTIGLGASRPSGLFETFSFQDKEWNFERNSYKINLEFGYMLEIQLRKGVSLLSYSKKNPLLKTGVLINSRQSSVNNRLNNTKLNYYQNNIALPVGILNSSLISDKKSKTYFEHGIGGYISFVAGEGIGSENLKDYKLSLFSQTNFGIYIETGFSFINLKKKRHSVSFKLAKELNQTLYRGNAKFPFDLRSFNTSVSYSVFEFFK